MVTSVQLGNFFTSNGKTVLGGVGGSGLDTQGLIDGLTEAKGLPKKALEDKIALNDKKSAALSEFQTLLAKFKDANNFLRNPPGVSNDADNVFKATTSSVSSNTAIAGSNYLNVTTEAGANVQSYSISEITSVAKATQQASTYISVANKDSAIAVFASPTAHQIQAGAITIRGKTITLSAGDTLSGVAAKFNAVSDTTKIKASIVQVESGKYELHFSGTETGLDNEFDLRSLATPDVIVDPNGVLAHFAFGVTNVQDASDASFVLNGTTITRGTNTIDDAVDGVTFNLLQATPALTTLSVTVSSDQALIKSGIINFINTYNELKTFAAKQTEVKSDGSGFAETALLHDSQVFRSTMDNISAFISGVVSGLDSAAPSLLADIGITLSNLPKSTDAPEVKNILTVDEGKLTSAIASQTDDVRRLFEFDLTADNTNLRVFKRTNAITESDFTITVNPFATQVTETLTVADADTAIVATVPVGNQFKAGVITINDTDITLADGDTLNQIITKFTAAAGTTGVAASLTTVSAGNYKITFTSTITSGSANFDLTSDSIDPDGVFDAISITATAAYKATYTVDSVPTTVDLDATALSSGEGYLLKGQDGTAFEGLQLIYSSAYSAFINVTATQGISDKIYNLSDGILTENTGSLALETKSLADSDTKLNEDIARIEDQITVFRNQLLLQFAELEKAISQVNTLLQSLQANTDARNNA
ncbi:MAG: hypothetical protein EBR02_03300 [Alphaproteobacteria bacterium]|nr:hypothetical protein [Alphaproteobacteria bacterium]